MATSGALPVRILILILVFAVANFLYSVWWCIMHSEFSASQDVVDENIHQIQQKIEVYPLPHVHLTDQPKWIQDYLQWHNEMRAQFPGDLLFSDPNAPPLLIRACSANEQCGGLHDRLGKLPWDLYLANKTKRVFLINWCKPTPLEEFLVPNEIDWSIPVSVDGFFAGSAKCSWRVNHMIDLFKGYSSARPQASFWEKDLDASLERAISGDFAKIKLLKSRILGDEARLRIRLQKEHEVDMLDWTPSFGQLFWLFFKPSTGLQRELDSVSNELQLSPNHYSAVHCRVRHPKAVPLGSLMEAKGPGGGPDKVGLLWSGESRRFAVETATRALKCVDTALSHEAEEFIYFYSDSEDLVRYMAHELTNESFLAANAALFEESPTDAAALQTVRSHRILARQIDSETLHIDRQLGHPAPAYYASFIDLLIAARARCVAVGVGNFALFAAKLSEDPCVVQYQSEVWGNEGVKQNVAKQCPADI